MHVRAFACFPSVTKDGIIHHLLGEYDTWPGRGEHDSRLPRHVGVSSRIWNIGWSWLRRRSVIFVNHRFYESYVCNYVHLDKKNILCEFGVARSNIKPENDLWRGNSCGYPQVSGVTSSPLDETDGFIWNIGWSWLRRRSVFHVWHEFYEFYVSHYVHLDNKSISCEFCVARSNIKLENDL